MSPIHKPLQTICFLDGSGQFIATFPAGWSPQMVARESYPKWPKHAGQGSIIAEAFRPYDYGCFPDTDILQLHFWMKLSSY